MIHCRSKANSFRPPHGNESAGLFWIDEEGSIRNQANEILYKRPWERNIPVIAFTISPDGSTFAVVTKPNHLYIFSGGHNEKEELPLLATPIRDVILKNEKKIYVLYGDGYIHPLGNAKPIKGTPNFGADAARVLIPHERGVYVVDCLGAVHNAEGVPFIRSPYYRNNDWIIDAIRNPNGEWAFLTNDGEILTFHESIEE